MVRITFALAIVDAKMIVTIYSHGAARVDKLCFVKHNAYMNDSSIFIFEKGQVARLRLIGESPGFPEAGLLPGITR